MTKIENVELRTNGDTLVTEINYPRNSKIVAVEVDLCDVRAADSVRVSYDFKRDGWKIEQAQVFEWSADDEVCDCGWKEVAFIQVWGSQIKSQE